MRLDKLLWYRQWLSAITEFDNEVRFNAIAAISNAEKGLELLGKLDANFGS